MRNTIIKHVYILVMLFLAILANAQDTDTAYIHDNDTAIPRRKPLIHKIGFDIRPSYIAPTSKFLYDDGYGNGLTIRKAAAFHLKYGFQFSPESLEGRLYPHTLQGVGLSYNLLGAPREIGNPLALYVFQSSRIVSINDWLSFDYEWNFGASFGWHPYNEVDNYQNKIIGSKINAYINLGFFLNARLSRYCNLVAGIDLSHYSNGNTYLPNAGLNTLGGRIGLVYTLNPAKDTHLSSKRPLPECYLPQPGFWQRVSYDVLLYGAIRAKGVVLGESATILPGHFGILGFNINPMYKFNRYLKAGISLDGQYDESANIYTDDIIQYDEKPQFYRPPIQEQIGIGLSARGEFSMPFFSINVGIGHNLYNNKGDLKGFYQILALKLSITRDLFLHVGYQLHKFHEPNNLMLGFGYRFHNK